MPWPVAADAVAHQHRRRPAYLRLRPSLAEANSTPNSWYMGRSHHMPSFTAPSLLHARDLPPNAEGRDGCSRAVVGGRERDIDSSHTHSTSAGPSATLIGGTVAVGGGGGGGGGDVGCEAGDGGEVRMIMP